MREASSQFRRVIKEIDYEASRGRYLSYAQLRRMLSGYYLQILGHQI